MNPDRYTKDTLYLRFKVAASNTVRPGVRVKLAPANAQPTNKALIPTIVESTAATDLNAIGIADGRVDPGFTSFAAGEEVGVWMYGDTVVKVKVGTGNVTVGFRVAQSSSTNGVTDAPAANAAGATMTISDGIVFSSGVAGDVVDMLVLPLGYVSA